VPERGAESELPPGDAVPSAEVVALSDLTREELIALVESHQEHGIRISFSGKSNAYGLSRRVRPRITRDIKKYGAGDERYRADNVLIEGDNLQA